MLTSGNVATPPTAPTCVVPESVPLATLVPIVSVTAPPKLVTVLPTASCAVTRTAGAIATPATTSLGCRVNASWATGTATPKSTPDSGLPPNDAQGPARTVWSTTRACQWYAVLSARPATTAVAMPPFATRAPEPPATPWNGVPTGCTSTSSRSWSEGLGSVTVALTVSDRPV